VRKLSLRVGVVVSLLVGLVVAASVSAQAGTPPPRPNAPDDVNRVASRLYCPVCENEPLDVCQTPACVQWKAQIAQYLAEGKSDEAIVQLFVQRYGQRVLSESSAQVAPIVWIGPILVVLAGGFYAFRIIRRMSQRGAAAPARPVAPAPTGDEYVDQVERELKQQL